MGYTTDFRGQFTLDRELDPKLRMFLVKFNETRHMARTFPDDKYGTEGEHYVDGGGFMGQDQDNTIIDHNRPPITQPGLWCQWVPTEDGKGMEWDGGEKFYDYIPWMQYIITNYLEPNGYIVNGTVEWRGEEWEDTGQIIVTDNILTMKSQLS